MEDQGNLMCPVCTLYLRSGMTLADHLSTHPKECIIDALVKSVNIPPSTPGDDSTAARNLNDTPSVMYQQFVNNYGPITNGSYQNTVITANVSNATNPSSFPVIISPQTEQLPQPATNPEPVNYNHYPQVYNYDYAATHNSQTDSFNYRPITNYGKEKEGYEIDPLSYQRNNQDNQIHDSYNAPASTECSNAQNVPPQTAPDLTDANNCHNNSKTQPNSPRKNRTSSHCSESCDGDLLDLDNQNRETNIGTVISNSHQIISPDRYSESGLNPQFASEALREGEAHNSEAQNPEYFVRNTNVDQTGPGEFIVPEKNEEYDNVSENNVDYDDNASVSSLESHHSSFDNLDSDSEEEFVICDDVESAKRVERENLNNSTGSNIEQGSDFHRTGDLIIDADEDLGEDEDARSDIDEDEDDMVDIDDDENSDDDGSVILSPIINIETDEMMPPHGELSGQDSLSATEENSLWSNHCGSSSPPYHVFFDVKQEAENKDKELDEAAVDTKVEKCPICSISFSHPDRFKIHIQSCALKKDDANLAGSSKDVISLCAKSEMGESKADEKKKYQCICCSVEVNTVKELSEHINLVHSLTSNQCPTCLEVFTTSIDFALHIRTVHPLECTVCGKYFNTRAGLQLHRKRHLSVRPHSCGVCSKSFVTKQKLQEHMNVHLNRAPIKCKLCPDNVSFKSYSNLIQHRRVVHAKLGKKIKDYFCVCGELFHSKKRLFWHSEMHGKPKSCRFCSRKFMHLSSLTRHIRRSHDQSYLPTIDRSKENVKCNVCQQTFLRTSLASHMQTHSGKKPYLCEICNKSFTTKWNLNAHRWIHMSRKTKPHKCKLCKAAFVHLVDLQAHERSHSKTRPFSCNHCGKQFIHQYNCIRHVREHEQEKRFTCEVCKKTFHRSYYLSEHMKIHSGVKPFSCHICGKASTTKSNHNKHVRTHHAREPVNSEV